MCPAVPVSWAGSPTSPSWTAGHIEDVTFRHLGQGPVGEQAQPAGVGRDHAALRRDELHLDAGNVGQHLVAPDNIKGREAIKEHYGQSHVRTFRLGTVTVIVMRGCERGPEAKMPAGGGSLAT